MKHLIILVFLVKITGFYSQAQIQSKFLDKIVSTPTNRLYSIVVDDRNDSLFFVDTSFRNRYKSIIKTDSGVFMHPNGTGRLYKLTQNDSLFYNSRLDKTTHFGYNIAAFFFQYKNQPYNLGGYGIWRINGQLRKYNFKDNEWDIVKLNKEVGLMHSKNEGAIYYDIKNGYIYTLFYQIKEEALKNDRNVDVQFVYEVMRLNLQTNDWEKLGKVTEDIVSKIANVKPFAMCPWGLLVFVGDKINLYNFRENSVQYLNTNKEGYQTIARKTFNTDYFFADSTFYYSNATKNTLDSIQFSINDFSEPKDKIYHTPINYNFIIVFVIFAVGVIGYFIYRYKKMQFNKQIEISNHKTFISENIIEKVSIKPLDERELSLVRGLFENAKANKTTSMEEVDKILGLHNKPIDIQKKHRSDIIKSINTKLSIVANTNEAIIDRIRNEDDKRSFSYRINDQYKHVIALIL